MDRDSGSKRKYFDYIVVGCGGIGSAALYWLSKRVQHGVLGIEQFSLGHGNGGSQDHSRIIRMAYHDDAYTRLTPDTYKAWEELERESGLQMLYRTGGIILARVGEHDHIVQQYADTMRANNIPCEWMTGSQLHRKFPQFTTDDRYVAVYQKDSGLVDAAIGNAVHVQLARGNGAAILENCAVLRIDRDKKGTVCVHTTRGDFFCRRIIVTAGAWINHVLGSLGVHVPIYVTQEQVTYLGTPHMRDFTKDKYPVWIFHSPSHDIYGLPIHGNSGTKVAVDAGGPVVTPDTRTFEPDAVREQVCLDLLQEILPSAIGPKLYTKTCLYAMPPDRNFIVDTCEKYGWKDVIVCNGAGHAYKFASLLGKILSEMAIDGMTKYDISAFNLDREALLDPSYEPVFLRAGSKVPASTKKQPDQAKL